MLSVVRPRRFAHPPPERRGLEGCPLVPAVSLSLCLPLRLPLRLLLGRVPCALRLEADDGEGAAQLHVRRHGPPAREQPELGVRHLCAEATRLCQVHQLQCSAAAAAVPLREGVHTLERGLLPQRLRLLRLDGGQLAAGQRAQVCERALNGAAELALDLRGVLADSARLAVERCEVRVQAAAVLLHGRRLGGWPAEREARRLADGDQRVRCPLARRVRADHLVRQRDGNSPLRVPVGQRLVDRLVSQRNAAASARLAAHRQRARDRDGAQVAREQGGG
mmetsp:Transcript_11636/g.29479  ORF Transcript_11636/g.29479 Transcript_11636/m.29479 type:complete len:278 (-) Transcript_11636:151-984(-)